MKLKRYITDVKFGFVWLAFAIFLIVMNGVTVKSAIIGLCGSLIYFLIGGNLVGTYLLEEEQLLVRVSLGGLIILSLLGLFGWLFIIFYRLGIFETAAVLAATLVLLILMVKLKGSRIS